MAAPTPAPHTNPHQPGVPGKSTNFRSDFDKVLFAFVEEHTYRAEEKLFNLQQEAYKYQQNKDAKLKESIVLEINRELPILQETLAETDSQLKRTDFSDFEKFLVEKLHNDVALLLTHFNHLKATLK